MIYMASPAVNSGRLSVPFTDSNIMGTTRKQTCIYSLQSHNDFSSFTRLADLPPYRITRTSQEVPTGSDRFSQMLLIRSGRDIPSQEAVELTSRTFSD